MQGSFYLPQYLYLCFRWQVSWHVHTLLLLLVGQVALSMKLQLSEVTNDYLIKCAVTVHHNVHAETNSKFWIVMVSMYM